QRAARNAVAVGRRIRKSIGSSRRGGKLANIVPTVPASLELQDLVPLGKGPRDPQGRECRLAARGLKSQGLAARHAFDNHLRQRNRRLIEGKIRRAAPQLL